MASEFTKGPWRRCFHLQSAENDASCPCGFRGGIWGADGEHVICEMGSTETVGQEGMAPPRYPRAVELANARLIETAPDLLRALKAIVERYGELMGRDCDRHDFACCVSSAEDVIAKAEGSNGR